MNDNRNLSLDNVSTVQLLKTLGDLNTEEAQRRWPVILFISILMIFGVIGNLHVLYIYTLRYKTSTYRLFVLTLAIIDLVACVISMPFEIADEIHPYNYFDEGSCKFFRFVNTCVAIDCALMLVLIASERYRKICRPYADQLSESSARHLALAVTCIAIIVTSPALYVYGKKTVHIPGYDVTGAECTWGDHMEGSIFGYIYYGYALLIIVMCMVTLSILYSMVGCHLKMHAHNVRRTLKKKNVYILNSARKGEKECSVTIDIKGDTIKEKRNMFGQNLQKSVETLEVLLDKKSESEIHEDQEKGLENKIAKHSDDVRDEILFESVSEKTELTRQIGNPVSDFNRNQAVNARANIDGDQNTFDNKSNSTDSQENDKNAVPEQNVDKYVRDDVIQENQAKVQNTNQSDPTQQNNKDGTQLQTNAIVKDNTQTRRISEASVASSTNAKIKIKESSNEKEARITKVLFTITMLFIISFVPYIVILIMYGINSEYEKSLSPSAYLLYLIGLRMYMINNAANCVLYSFFDMKFRLIIKQMYLDLYYRLKKYITGRNRMDFKK